MYIYIITIYMCSDFLWNYVKVSILKICVFACVVDYVEVIAYQ